MLLAKTRANNLHASFQKSNEMLCIQIYLKDILLDIEPITSRSAQAIGANGLNSSTKKALPTRS